MRLDDVQSDTTAGSAARPALGAAGPGRPPGRRDWASRASPIAFPPELLDSAHPRARDAVRGQRELYEARTASLNSQLQVLRARIEQQQAAIRGAQGQIAATRNQLDLIRQEEQIRRGLVGQGLGRLPDLLALQRAMAGLEGTMQDLNGQMDRANATIAEAERQIQQVLDQRHAGGLDRAARGARQARRGRGAAPRRRRRADPPRHPRARSRARW